MNVLLVIKGLGRGGAERIVADCARLGDRSRFRYEVGYSLSHKHALVSELRSSAVVVEHLGDHPLAAVRRIRSLVRDRGIDIVHVHSPLIGAVSRAMGVGVPIIYTEHNLWSRYGRRTRWLNAATFQRNRHVFAVSDEVRRSISDRARRSLNGSLETLRHGLHPRFAERWAGCVDVREELGFDAGAPLVVCVANFKPFKGQEHLLRAAALLVQRCPEARFVFVGVGPREAAMRSLADELALSDKVAFAGSRDDAPRVMASGDVFALPSEREGLPIALMEAMALGKAAVVTSAGGIPEVVEDGREASIVPPADPNALAWRIMDLLSDSSARDRMGAAAEARAAHFDMRNAVRRIESVYAELAS